MSKLNLRQAREKAGVSVEFVAEQMGVSVELVKSWEAGERSPEMAQGFSLSMLYGMSLNDITFNLQAQEAYRMTIEERVELYKSLYKECKALEPVANTLAKGYKQADPRKRLELIRELDTELAEVYMVRIPVITCGVRDDNYVHSTKEIYLADPELEAFLHRFRHHLQNEARELNRKYLLMEDDPKADYRIPYREANSMLYGEDDAVAWSRFLIENC